MAGGAYSIPLFQGNVPAGQVHLFGTVPAGFVWVVRDMTVYGAAAAGSYTDLRVGAAQLRAIYFDRSAGGVYHHWSGRLVLPAGTQVRASAIGGAADITISGYQLSTVPG